MLSRFILPALALVVAVVVPTLAAAEIRIGIAGPMTGAFQVFGDEMRAGAEQAVADINAKGGLLGQQLVLEVGDDTCDAKQASAVANQMTGRGIVFMAGHFCSFASIPASSVYNDAHIVEISPASPNAKYTDSRPGPGIFRLAGRDDAQGKVAGAYLAKEFAGKRVAVLDDTTTYGKGLADATRQAMNDGGLKEILSETYAGGSRDFGALVSKLKAANIDVVYVGGYDNDAAEIAKEMQSQGMSARIFSGDALATDEFWQIAGGAGEGALMTYPPDPRKDPANEALVKEFRDKSVEPEGYVLPTYAAIAVWSQAVAKAGSTDFDKVVAVLDKEKFESPLGTVAFNANGDSSLPPYVVWEWHDGRYDYARM